MPRMFLRQISGGLLVAGLSLAGCGDEEGPAQIQSGIGADASISDAGFGGDGATVGLGDGGTNDGSVVADPNAPTWHKDIAPLVATKCTSCHEEGGIAPFSLKSYATAKAFAEPMAVAVEAGRMPPFLAQETADCKPKLPWLNDIRLSAAEKKLLRAWADAGAPEGNAAAASPVVPPAPIVLEREDVVMPLPKEVTVEGTKDLHTCIIIDPKLTKDTFVTGRLITSGNKKVLHHVVSYLLKPKDVDDSFGLGLAVRPQTRAELVADVKTDTGVGPGESYDCFGGPALETVTFEMLDAWAPGGVPNMAPADSGQPMSKDALVLLDVHYHPIGAPEKDSTTKLSLMTTDVKPINVSRTVLIGNFEGRSDVPPVGVGDLIKQADETTAAFGIPANVKDHIEEMTWTWALPNIPGVVDPVLRVYGMGTHMHYVGRDMIVTLEHPTPAAGQDAKECLIQTPSYDFNWQRGYGYDGTFEQLPQMKTGDVLHFRCNYDNTMDNRFVAKALSEQGLSAPKDVKLGEDTLDEMCLGAIGIIYPNPN